MNIDCAVAMKEEKAEIAVFLARASTAIDLHIESSSCYGTLSIQSHE